MRVPVGDTALSNSVDDNDLMEMMMARLLLWKYSEYVEICDEACTVNDSDLYVFSHCCIGLYCIYKWNLAMASHHENYKTLLILLHNLKQIYTHFCDAFDQ